jgi:hypothetical protein
MRYHPLPDGPTPAWLTAALRESGALPRGASTRQSMSIGPATDRRRAEARLQ